MVHVELCYEFRDELLWHEAEDDELAKRSVFPNAISRVCRYWDAVLANFPEFWTRIVVHLDQPYCIELLKASLKRSDPHNIQSLTIIRSVEGQEANDGQERDTMIAAMKVVLKEYFRIEALTIKTYTSDSLPRIPLGWDTLRSLCFESLHRGNHSSGPHPSIHDASDKAVDWEALSVLSLTGPAFVTLSRGKRWRKAMSEKYLGSLTVSRLRAHDGGEKPFTFDELWASYRAFSSVEDLTLMDVDVPYVPSGWKEHQAKLDDLHPSGTYTFDTIPARVLRAFYYNIEDIARCTDHSSRHRDFDVYSMTFRNCQFFGFQKDSYSTLSLGAVEVADIAHSDSLSLCFEMVEAKELHINNCSGLDDSSIEAMMLPLRKRGQRPALTEMHELEITDCPNFSMSSLRELVKRRMKWCEDPEVEDGEWCDDPEVEVRVCSIDRLVLRGSCPLVSDEDETWFKENVEDFEIDRES